MSIVPRPRAIGGHHSPSARSTIWLTPPHIIEALGGADSFDLDPCAAPPPRPWATARRMNGIEDADGLAIEWEGRVWLNPPYSSAVLGDWLGRLSRHRHGTALIFARTETEAFAKYVWGSASGLLFLFGRLNFHRPIAPDPGRCAIAAHEYEEFEPGSWACRWCGRAQRNAGAPSVLCAYGQEDLDRLATADLDGHLVPLRFARFVMIEHSPTWSEAIESWLKGQEGEFTLSDAYRAFAGHPKARRNPHWQAKIRQKMQEHAIRVSPGIYRPAQLDMLFE